MLKISFLRPHLKIFPGSGPLRSPPCMESGSLAPPVLSLSAVFSHSIWCNAPDFRNSRLRLQIIAPPPSTPSYCKALKPLRKFNENY